MVCFYSREARYAAVAAVSGAGSCAFGGVVVWNRFFYRDIRVVYLATPTALCLALATATFSFCALRTLTRQLNLALELARERPEAAAEVADAI